MNPTGSPEIIGIGAITLSFITLIYKMWREHTEISKKAIDVISHNAQISQKLIGSIEENTKVTQETRDKFTKLMLGIIRNVKK